MGIFDASLSNGGSVQSASSWMQTNAADARTWSEQQAAVAFERQKELQTMAQDFNALEAQKARDFNSAEAMKAAEWNAAQAQAQRQWQTDMANTIYTRSVKNMKEAGINPILAANMGLSGANVGSGATASMSPASGSGASVGAGSAPLAQNFMDSASGSQSSGQSWTHSESGLATALMAMGSMISAALGAVNAGSTLNMIMDSGSDILNSSSKETKALINKIADASGLPNAENIKDQNNNNNIILDLLNAGQMKATGMGNRGTSGKY